MTFSRIDSIRASILDQLRNGIKVSDGSRVRLFSLQHFVPEKELQKLAWRAAAVNAGDPRDAEDVGKEVGSLWRDCVQAHAERYSSGNALDALDGLSMVPIRTMQGDQLHETQYQSSEYRDQARQ